MSINSAMLAGVSGLISNSSAMAVIADNIANVNTTAYKANRSDFSNLVNSQSKSTTYNAGGTKASTRQLIQSQGSINSTSVSTDLAIQGEGFFVVTPEAQANSSVPSVMFTRVGSFEPNDEGYLVNNSGYALRGWNLDDTGNVVGSTFDFSSLQSLNVNSIADSAAPSTYVSITGNLKSSTTVSAASAAVVTASAGAYNAATNNMASGAVTPDANWQFQIVDSLGGAKNFQAAFLKSATPNQWYVEIYSSPASNVVSGAPLANGQIATGTLAFDTSGAIDTVNTTPALLANLSIGAYNAGAPAAGSANWATTSGLAAQSFGLQIGQTANDKGAISQYDSPTALNSTTSDGSPSGDLASLEIDAQGYVTASFTSGLVKKIYKIPVATFVAPDALKAESGGIYLASAGSGAPSLKSAGTSGAGDVQGGALEASNVDLALEFSRMIITQRAYSASSKIITTADQMLDELIRMKQ